MPMNVHFMCPSCWVRCPAKDRQQLGHMLRRHQDTKTKLASVVKKMRESATRG